MALLTWKDEYSVGSQTIDKQHKVLVDCLNDLHAAMMKGQASAVVGSLLRKLIDYTKEHFSTEERMMEAAKYPSLAEHRAHHVELTKQVVDYAGRFERGEITLNIQLMNFLRDWLTNHILKEDMQYSACLKTNGVR